MNDKNKTISLVAEKESPFAVFEHLPKTFRVELVCDRDRGILDAQVFDATNFAGKNQKIIVGCDELNAELQAGWRLVKILRPRTDSLKFLIER